MILRVLLFIFLPILLQGQGAGKYWTKDSLVLYETPQLGSPHFYSIRLDSLYDGDTFWVNLYGVNTMHQSTRIRLFRYARSAI